MYVEGIFIQGIFESLALHASYYLLSFMFDFFKGYLLVPAS